MLRKVHVDGETLDAAHEQLGGLAQDGEFIWSTRVTRKSNFGCRDASGTTVNEALELARTLVPEGAVIVEEPVSQTDGREQVSVKAFDADEARQLAIDQRAAKKGTVRIDGTTVQKAAKPVLGLFPRRQEFAVDLGWDANVRLRFRTKPRIQGWLARGSKEFEKPYTHAYCLDRGMACSFHYLSNWYFYSNLHTRPIPTRRMFQLGDGGYGVVDGEPNSAELNFVPGIVLDELVDRSARQQKLTSQIHSQTVGELRSVDVKFRDDLPALGGCENTLVVTTSFETRPDSGQINVSCIKDRIHYYLSTTAC